MLDEIAEVAHRDRLRDCEGSGTRAKPPKLDEFFSIGEAPLRAAEFAALE